MKHFIKSDSNNEQRNIHQDVIDNVVGHAEGEAISYLKTNKIPYRIMSKDGEAFFGTCDIIYNRCNLHISKNKVVSVNFG